MSKCSVDACLLIIQESSFSLDAVVKKIYVRNICSCCYADISTICFVI